MKMNLFGKGKDWIKAPIAGTTILACHAGLLFRAWQGDLHGMLLFLILSEIVSARRDKYLEDEK